MKEASRRRKPVGTRPLKDTGNPREEANNKKEEE